MIGLFPFRDTAGQERFRTISAQYYRGAKVSDLLEDVERVHNDSCVACRVSCWCLISPIRNHLIMSQNG